jgi:hypothetical protein
MELARFLFTRLPLIGIFIVAQKELLNLFTAAGVCVNIREKVPVLSGLFRRRARTKAAWAEILSPAYPCLEEFPAVLGPVEYPALAAEYPVLVF